MSKLPNFETAEEFAEFVETHDTSEYWDDLPVEQDVQVNQAVIRRQRMILELLGDAIFAQVRHVAESRQIPYETLIRTWVQERLAREVSG